MGLDGEAGEMDLGQIAFGVGKFVIEVPIRAFIRIAVIISPPLSKSENPINDQKHSGYVLVDTALALPDE